VQATSSPQYPLPALAVQERIRTGKELAAAKKLEEELVLKRNLEQRQREKDEARLAREKIRLKLGERAGWAGGLGTGTWIEVADQRNGAALSC
jgi:hypothetical protein